VPTVFAKLLPCTSSVEGPALSERNSQESSKKFPLQPPPHLIFRCFLSRELEVTCREEDTVALSMSTITHELQPLLNRRSGLRHKVHAAAYVSFGTLDFHAVLDISESGVAIQCPSWLALDREVILTFFFAEYQESFSVGGRVIWSDFRGRTGLGFRTVANSTVDRLREWFFLNALVGVANISGSHPSKVMERFVPPLNHFDTSIGDVSEAKKGQFIRDDVAGALAQIALRAHFLLHASGVAIALAGSDPSTMVCTASVGHTAPPVGSTFELGSGFSAECVRTGKIFRCGDTEADHLVDREICQALSIRSILAVPVHSSEKVVGLLEIFSQKPNAFGETDDGILQELAEMISSAFQSAPNSANPAEHFAKPFDPASTSSPPDENADVLAKQNSMLTEGEDTLSTFYGHRTHRNLLYCTIALIALALFVLLSPWAQKKLRVANRNRGGETSSSLPTNVSAKSDPSLSSDEIKQLKDLATRHNPAAENAMGLLYAHGDDKNKIQQDQNEAVRWFTKAAEDGSLPAQYKLALLFWDGHGVSKDTGKAYFWAVLARAGGQEGSKDLAQVLANGMTPAQTAAIERRAEMWFQYHQIQAKPKSQTTFPVRR
jgi:GAF domain-containing protein